MRQHQRSSWHRHHHTSTMYIHPMAVQHPMTEARRRAHLDDLPVSIRQNLSATSQPPLDSPESQRSWLDRFHHVPHINVHCSTIYLSNFENKIDPKGAHLPFAALETCR